MSWKIFRILFSSLVVGIASAQVYADPPPVSPAGPPQVAPSRSRSLNDSKKPKKKKRREQKETEGSEAPGRFEADTILKSRYELNGQPLEVDPD